MFPGLVAQDVPMTVTQDVPTTTSEGVDGTREVNLKDVGLPREQTREHVQREELTTTDPIPAVDK